jgi:type I site-specific restriction endonuclease
MYAEGLPAEVRLKAVMATGAGKTHAAVNAAYRLLKHGGFNRVLFLVDRNNLADQTLAEFQSYRTLDDGRRFTEIYDVDKLTGPSTWSATCHVARGSVLGQADRPGT